MNTPACVAHFIAIKLLPQLDVNMHQPFFVISLLLNTVKRVSVESVNDLCCCVLHDKRGKCLICLMFDWESVNCLCLEDVH